MLDNNFDNIFDKAKVLNMLVEDIKGLWKRVRFYF